MRDVVAARQHLSTGGEGHQPEVLLSSKVSSFATRGLQPSHTRRPLKQRTNESGKHRTLDSICCNAPIQPTTDGPTLGSYARSLTHKCDTDMRATLPTDRGPFQSQTAVSQPLPGTDTHTAWTAMREHDMECAGARQQSLLHVHAHGHRAYPLPPLPPTAAIAAPGGMQTPSGLHAHTHA